MSDNKFFRASPEYLPGYGPRIFIDAINIDEASEEDYGYHHVPAVLRKQMDLLSVWGGNISSAPSKYLMWEFLCDSPNYARACNLLMKNGWKIKLLMKNGWKIKE